MAGRPAVTTGKVQAGAAVAVAAVLLVAVYLTLGGPGNGGEAGRCPADAALARVLGPLVKGEVAAFQLTQDPRALADLAFGGTEEEPLRLGDFAGKVTLLNLWATWCAPCRQEMPALDRLQAALGGEDFAVVPVSIDTGDRARPAAFLDSIGVTELPLYTDRSTEIFESLKQRGLALGLPVTVLVGRDGCHIGHMNGPAEWDSDDAQALIEAALAAGAAPDPTS